MSPSKSLISSIVLCHSKIWLLLYIVLLIHNCLSNIFYIKLSKSARWQISILLEERYFYEQYTKFQQPFFNSIVRLRVYFFMYTPVRFLLRLVVTYYSFFLSANYLENLWCKIYWESWC